MSAMLALEGMAYSPALKIVFSAPGMTSRTRISTRNWNSSSMAPASLSFVAIAGAPFTMVTMRGWPSAVAGPSLL